MNGVSSQQTRATDYALWTIEELRDLASQLRIPDARTKSRRQLIELFDVGPHRAAERDAPSRFASGHGTC